MRPTRRRAGIPHESGYLLLDVEAAFVELEVLVDDILAVVVAAAVVVAFEVVACEVVEVPAARVVVLLDGAAVVAVAKVDGPPLSHHLTSAPSILSTSLYGSRE